MQSIDDGVVIDGKGVTDVNDDDTGGTNLTCFEAYWWAMVVDLIEVGAVTFKAFPIQNNVEIMV